MLNKHQRLQSGFTLLEIVLVVFMIGIVMSVAVSRFATDNAGDIVKTESRRLIEILQYAIDESVITGGQIGIYVEADQYHFVTYDNNKWRPIADTGVLRSRKVPAPLQLSLVTSGFNQSPPADDSGVQPQSMIYPTGQMIPPFEISLKAGENGPSARLNGNIIGEFEMELALQQ